MKIKDLVAQLLKHDQENEILVEADDEGGAYDIGQIVAETVQGDFGIVKPIAVIKIIHEFVYLPPD
jgi:hypothetical protein